jgi:hypothetical protein
MIEVVSRKQAMSSGLIKYNGGRPCVKGHSERYTCDGACVLCARTKPKNIVLQRARQKRYREKYPDRRAASFKQWDDANREHRRAYFKNKHATDVNARLAYRLRVRMWDALRRGRAGSAVKDLGCTIDEFRTFIERKFAPGMSWANYGKWHLDHKKPLASFDLTDRDQFLKAAHFTNYQPLWAVDNIRKGAKTS